MAQLTVRNLDRELVRRLKIRAAEHNRFAETEHRAILEAALRSSAGSFWEKRLRCDAPLGVAAPAPATTHNSKDALWRTERLAEVIDAYRQALPGKLRVISFEISFNRAELQVQDPAKPKHVDQYDYEHN
jgi:plasmid stability protein